MSAAATPEGVRAERPSELTYDELAFPVSPESLGFETTDGIEADGNWLGQERALAALELGLEIRHAGFNVYVCGLAGTHRDRALADLVRGLTADHPSPGDRVLVQNFQNRDRPKALDLPAGMGVRLRDDMRELVAELKRVLPETFRRETFELEKERLSEKFGSQGEQIQRQLAERAARDGFALQPGPNDQIAFIPLVDGRPMKPEEVEKLTDEKREELAQVQKELYREVKAGWRQHRNLLRQLSREVKEAERRVADEVVTPLVEELLQTYTDPGVRAYLEEVHREVLENLGAFRERPPGQPMMPMFLDPTAIDGEQALLDYEINVLVDNGGNTGAPVVVETWPTYKNLFGAVERMVDRSGKLVTNFTRVIPGSLLRAHGGCIIINLLDALSEPLVWRSLKQCLKTGELEIEGYDPFALFTTSALKPEPMSLDTRVLLTGPTYAFQILSTVDEDFCQIFKVQADFGHETDGEAARRNFPRQVARIAKSEGLPPFDAAAVVGLMAQAARLLGDRRKLPSQWSDLGDLMREAAFWTRKNGKATVGAEEVQQVVAQRVFRHDRIEEKVRELVVDHSLLVDVDGSRIGQVNGLVVTDLVGHPFGRPSRITATVSVGALGVIAVDREAKMTGKSYDKAVFIVTAYLRHLYAQEFPLSLSASLCFEQSYAGIDGDSASAAELFGLVSSLSGVALRQDLAVTGSANQFGEVQPIGGANEKVEGFFYVCRAVGLTGRQGVILPQQNVDNLVLCRDVLEAVRQGRFHIYSIRTLDQGLELLTGARAGRVGEEGTIHDRASRRLRQLARRMRSFTAPPRRPTADTGSRSS